MADICHEVAAHLFGLVNVGDVRQAHHDLLAAIAAVQADDGHVVDGAVLVFHGDLQGARFRAVENLVDGFQTGRIADDADEALAFQLKAELQPGGIVREHYLALRIQNENRVANVFDDLLVETLRFSVHGLRGPGQ